MQESWPTQHQNIHFNLKNLSVVTLLGVWNNFIIANARSFIPVFIKMNELLLRKSVAAADIFQSRLNQVDAAGQSKQLSAGKNYTFGSAT